MERTRHSAQQIVTKLREAETTSDDSGKHKGRDPVMNASRRGMSTKQISKSYRRG